ncbi:S-layer homology domain-containing protein [Agathobaculum butyriciproducens]|uniref:S-layer homology domain-containing protein n=1 Tax=Agathobaculum butyriciproducens TaxID=1628085 RepID=A0AAW4VXX4_9FIRM|nr:S-layer homology domain-containing protein [Agathobaculum butyriciproducens]
MQPNASAAPSAAFSDCENESVCLAAALGIVTGYDDGTFRPYQSITRQEAALIPYHAPTASRCAPF